MVAMFGEVPNYINVIYVAYELVVIDNVVHAGITLN